MPLDPDSLPTYPFPCKGFTSSFHRLTERGSRRMHAFLSFCGSLLLYLGLLLGLFLVPLGLPGNWLILGIAILVAISKGFKGMTLAVLGLLLVLAAIGEILEFLLGVYVAKRYGASRWGMLGAFFGGLIGGIAGMPFIFPGVGTMIGAFLGAFTGAFALEYLYRARSDASYRAGLGAFIGRILAIVVKLEIGIAMVLIIIVKG